MPTVTGSSCRCRQGVGPLGGYGVLIHCPCLARFGSPANLLAKALF